MFAHCGLCCAALRSSWNSMNLLCVIVGSFAVLFTNPKRGKNVLLLFKGFGGGSPPSCFYSRLTNIEPPDFASLRGTPLDWGLGAAMHYLLSFQVATEASVHPSLRPCVRVLCQCTIDFLAEAIFTLMQHEIVCHIIPMSRTPCLCVVGVKRCTRARQQ